MLTPNVNAISSARLKLIPKWSEQSLYGFSLSVFTEFLPHALYTFTASVELIVPFEMIVVREGDSRWETFVNGPKFFS